MELDQFDLNNQDEFFKQLVDKALSGEHSKFEFIRDLNMRKTARLYRNSTKKVAELFDSLVQKLIKQYSEQVLGSIQSVELLLIMKQFEKCRDYYLKEKDIAKDMLSEFRTYLFSGHLFDQYVLAAYRPDYECVDYRKLPVKFF